MISIKEGQAPSEEVNDLDQSESSNGPVAWVQKYLDLADLLMRRSEQHGDAKRHRHSAA
jgi:hypothetical protein